MRSSTQSKVNKMGQVTGTGTIFIKSNFQQPLTGKTCLQAHTSDTELHTELHTYTYRTYGHSRLYIGEKRMLVWCHGLGPVVNVAANECFFSD